MSHTPGPWRLDLEDDSKGSFPEHEDGHGRRYIRAEGQHGALMGGVRYYPWTPDNLADWQLIAAAPDLLAALKLALSSGFACPTHVEEIMLAAVAKAEPRAASTNGTTADDPLDPAR